MFSGTILELCACATREKLVLLVPGLVIRFWVQPAAQHDAAC